MVDDARREQVSSEQCVLRFYFILFLFLFLLLDGWNDFIVMVNFIVENGHVTGEFECIDCLFYFM